MIRLITHNWKYKAGSVVLAGLLWLGLVEEPELSTSVLAPIQYKNLPKDMEINSDVSDKVHLEVRGPSSKLSPAMLADSSVLLDLDGVKRAGDRTYPIDAATLVLPTGVQLERSVPAQVRLHFERRLYKEVPVLARIRQRPDQGFEVVAQVVEPSRLRVVGPESRVMRIERVETDPIDLDRLAGAVETFAVHAYLLDPQVRFEGDGSVKVRVEVRKTAGSPR